MTERSRVINKERRSAAIEQNLDAATAAGCMARVRKNRWRGRYTYMHAGREMFAAFYEPAGDDIVVA